MLAGPGLDAVCRNLPPSQQQFQINHSAPRPKEQVTLAYCCIPQTLCMLERLLCMLAGPGGDAVCRNLPPSPQHLQGHCSPPRSGGGGHARLLRRSHARGEAGKAGYADVKSQVQVQMHSLHSLITPPRD